MMDKDLPSQLDRWLFWAAISGWDSAAPLQLSLQERGLAVAVQVQLRELLNLKENMFNDPILFNDPINTLMAETLPRTCLWFSVLRYSNICPDPWTLCQLVAQITNLTKLWEWTFLAPKLPLLVYRENYRELLSGVEETTMHPSLV